MTQPYWQPPGGKPPTITPEQPPPKKRNRLRWVLLSIGAGLALIIGLAVAFAPSANHGSIRAQATPSAAPASTSPFTTYELEFISDARSQYHVGPEVTDQDLAQVGTAICDAAKSGDDRATLDKVPAQNGMGVTGGGADSLVNLALRDICGGLQPKATWHALGHYTGSGQWNGPSFKVLGHNPVLKVTYHYSGNGDSFSANNFVADLMSPDDDLQIANDIAYSGGKTTRLYPDLSFGGSRRYHLEVQIASGSWSFTIKERY